MLKLSLAAAVGLSLLISGCSTTSRLNLPPLKVIDQCVDLSRYVGKWYEIASFPQRFQRGCTATTAAYTIREDGMIDVFNSCRIGSSVGRAKTAKGWARVVDKTTNAKLQVSFFRPFWGDYWIIDLGSEYDYAVVGHPSRDYLWILARNPTIESGVYDVIISRLRSQGYETERLKKTDH